MSNEKNILIISPHPDDDVIGMGGTILMKAENSENITIIYVTNGSGTILTEELKGLSKEEVVKMRKEEAKLSLRTLLGDSHKAEQHFLDYDSQILFNEPSKYEKDISQIMASKKFQEIYLPYPKDRHPTHRQISELSLKLIKKLSIKATVFAYETWDPIAVDDNTVFIDIGPYYKRKLSAVSCHKSQCNITPFDEGIIAKNRYNAVFKSINSKNSMEYAEIFHKL